MQTKIEFKFTTGLPHLGGNRYAVVFAVNDQAMKRNICLKNFGEFEFTNSKIGPNEHLDIVHIEKNNLSITATEDFK